MPFETDLPFRPRLAPTCRLVLPVLLALLILPCAGWAKSKSETSAPARTEGSGKVDFTRVHQLYLNGDFDAAIVMLEDYLKENRQYTHDDSVFIYKHLGVMYAAQYETREKGKYYMHKLLTVEPTARIMDMYASDMIYMIFKNIQEEYASTRMQLEEKRRTEPDSSGTLAGGASADGQRQGTASRAQPAKDSGSRKWFWVGVSAATVAAGIGLYVALSDEAEPPKDKEIRF